MKNWGEEVGMADLDPFQKLSRLHGCMLSSAKEVANTDKAEPTSKIDIYSCVTGFARAWWKRDYRVTSKLSDIYPPLKKFHREVRTTALDKELFELLANCHKDLLQKAQTPTSNDSPHEEPPP